jgi:hypothetical protein
LSPVSLLNTYFFLVGFASIATVDSFALGILALRITISNYLSFEKSPPCNSFLVTEWQQVPFASVPTCANLMAARGTWDMAFVPKWVVALENDVFERWQKRAEELDNQLEKEVRQIGVHISPSVTRDEVWDTEKESDLRYRIQLAGLTEAQTKQIVSVLKETIVPVLQHR